MNWQEVCEHPSLQDLPFKIELNPRGHIVMVPAKTLHSVLQTRISREITKWQSEGESVVECALQMPDGSVRVPDVVWFSSTRFAQVVDSSACAIIPEICVEVMSPSNSLSEMAEKRKLYFVAGAEEVWICSNRGNLSFYNANGKIAQSALIPAFPQQIKIL
jgi:Uma2 family endonuclease